VATVDLSDAYQKLARAREHVAEMEKAGQALLNPDLHRLRFERDKHARRLKVIIDSQHPPDKRINSIIGDIVGNLRSVLDYVVVALVEPITGKPQDIHFPFADDVKGFAGVVTKASLSVCAQAIKDHFISEVQAYKGGKGEPLWVLNKLRNIDKHRFLITTVNLAGLRASWRVGNNVFTNCGASVMAGQTGTFLECPDNVEFTDKPRPTFEIRFNEFPHIPHTSAISLLHGIASHTERLLDTLKIIA
jgi:hypothetical protein